MTRKSQPAPRSLQEWMERHGVNAEGLIKIVREETGHVISRTTLSFILTGSRRCSTVNSVALSAVTGVPSKILREWPRVSGMANLSGRRSKRVA